MAKRVSPDEAKALMDGQGYVYLDVRSVPEFQAGHPAGAYNIPLNHAGPAGMAPNPDFLAVVEKAFPKDAPLIVGCQGGGRSARAAALLEANGFTNVVDQTGGFEGRGAGWRPRGLPTSTTAEAERTWDGLAAAKARG